MATPKRDYSNVYWRTKRCHVVLSKENNELAIETINDLTNYRDQFIDECARSGGIVDYLVWDQEFYRMFQTRYPTCATDMRLALLENTIKTLEAKEKAMPNLWELVLDGKFRLPQEDRIRIFGHGGIGFRTDDGRPTEEHTDWIFVPYFGIARLRRKYLNQIDIDRIHYMELRHYPESGEWFLNLKIKVPYGYKATELQSRELMPALAVSFGVDTLVTCLTSDGAYDEFVNVAIDKDSAVLQSRIHELDQKLHRQIIGTAHQMGYNTDDPHFDVRDMSINDRKRLETSKAYLKTARVLGRLKCKYANRKYQERNHIMKLICRGDWKYVVLDTPDFRSQLDRRTLFGYPGIYLDQRIEETGLNILDGKIRAECVDRALPYFQTTPRWNGWRRCSKCAQLNTLERLDNGEVRCKKCGFQTLPHVNNCNNLLKYGESAHLEKHQGLY